MLSLDEIIKGEEAIAEACEEQASMCDLTNLYERNVAFENGKCAERHRQIVEWLKELKRLREKDTNAILDNIKEEIKTKIEQEDFAHSVFLHEEKDKIKAEWCVGKIKAYNNVIKLIDRKKVRD
jgi:adenine C2-methylase RlmN of 23S rRNA A2503 and tRNA A37